jgi:hypothetical protein
MRLTPANEPPPDLGGWDKTAMEQFEIMMHALVELLEKGGFVEVPMFFYISPMQKCEIGMTEYCGPGRGSI